MMVMGGAVGEMWHMKDARYRVTDPVTPGVWATSVNTGMVHCHACRCVLSDPAHCGVVWDFTTSPCGELWCGPCARSRDIGIMLLLGAASLVVDLERGMAYNGPRSIAVPAVTRRSKACSWGRVDRGGRVDAWITGPEGKRWHGTYRSMQRRYWEPKMWFERTKAKGRPDHAALFTDTQTEVGDAEEAGERAGHPHG